MPEIDEIFNRETLFVAHPWMKGFYKRIKILAGTGAAEKFVDCYLNDTGTSSSFYRAGELNIDRCLYWSETPQGHEYWERLDDMVGSLPFADACAGRAFVEGEKLYHLNNEGDDYDAGD